MCVNAYFAGSSLVQLARADGVENELLEFQRLAKNPLAPGNDWEMAGEPSADAGGGVRSRALGISMPFTPESAWGD
jgi:hypothetical protein